MGKHKIIKCPKCQRQYRSDYLSIHLKSINCLKVRHSTSQCKVLNCNVPTSKSNLSRHIKKHHPNLVEEKNECPVFGCTIKVSKPHVRRHIYKYHPKYAGTSIRQIRSNSKEKKSIYSHQQQQNHEQLQRKKLNWTSSLEQAYQHDEFIFQRNKIVERGFQVKWIQQRLSTPGNYHIQGDNGLGKTSCVKFCLQGINHLFLCVYGKSVEWISSKIEEQMKKKDIKMQFKQYKRIVLDQYEQLKRFPAPKNMVLFSISNAEVPYTDLRFKPIQYKKYMQYFANSSIKECQYNFKFKQDLRMIQKQEQKRRFVLKY